MPDQPPNLTTALPASPELPERILIGARLDTEIAAVRAAEPRVGTKVGNLQSLCSGLLVAGPALLSSGRLTGPDAAAGLAGAVLLGGRRAAERRGAPVPGRHQLRVRVRGPGRAATRTCSTPSPANWPSDNSGGLAWQAGSCAGWPGRWTARSPDPHRAEPGPQSAGSGADRR